MAKSRFLELRGGMGVRAALTAERLRRLLSYSPRSGVFRWLITRGPRARVGDTAGRINSGGYLKIVVDGKQYGANRLAWLHVHGVWPSARVGFRDGNLANNQIANLREGSRSQHLANSRLRKDNKCGLKGVSFERSSGRWMANVNKAGFRHYLGLYDTKEQAHAAYVKAARRLHGEFSRAQ